MSEEPENNGEFEEPSWFLTPAGQEFLKQLPSLISTVGDKWIGFQRDVQLKAIESQQQAAAQQAEAQRTTMELRMKFATKAALMNIIWIGTISVVLIASVGLLAYAKIVTEPGLAYIVGTITGASFMFLHDAYPRKV